jgi:hypothetical protein
MQMQMRMQQMAMMNGMGGGMPPGGGIPMQMGMGGMAPRGAPAMRSPPPMQPGNQLQGLAPAAQKPPDAFNFVQDAMNRS